MDKNNQRVNIIKFLQWNDKNGIYLDAECDLAEQPRMNYEEAVKYLFGILNDDFYYNIVDNIFELEYEEVIQLAKENNFYDPTMEKLDLLLKKENPSEEFYRSLL